MFGCRWMKMVYTPKWQLAQGKGLYKPFNVGNTMFLRKPTDCEFNLQ